MPIPLSDHALNLRFRGGLLLEFDCICFVFCNAGEDTFYNFFTEIYFLCVLRETFTLIFKNNWTPDLVKRLFFGSMLPSSIGL